MGKVLASADIGSNTVHLLVAEANGSGIRRIDNRSEWIGLGESVARSGTIGEPQAAQLIQLLKEFRQAAAVCKAEESYIFATEAVRIARNHRDVLDRIKSETGISVEVISPRVEAEFSLRGSMLDSRLTPNMMFFEVGGGSAQTAHVLHGEISWERSLPIGTGRLIAETDLTNPCPPVTLQKARDYIRRHLEEIEDPQASHVAVASGGVARGLWRALHPDADKKLAIEEIQYLGWSAARLTVEQASMRFGCKLRRAATLLPGALVYEELMRHFGLTEIRVSEYGVREGAVLSMAEGRVKSWPG